MMRAFAQAVVIAIAILLIGATFAEIENAEAEAAHRAEVSQ